MASFSVCRMCWKNPPARDIAHVEPVWDGDDITVGVCIDCLQEDGVLCSRVGCFKQATPTSDNEFLDKGTRLVYCATCLEKTGGQRPCHAVGCNVLPAMEDSRFCEECRCTVDDGTRCPNQRMRHFEYDPTPDYDACRCCGTRFLMVRGKELPRHERCKSHRQEEHARKQGRRRRIR